jgi:hypothetical protein
MEQATNQQLLDAVGMADELIFRANQRVVLVLARANRAEQMLRDVLAKQAEEKPEARAATEGRD